MEDSPRQTLPRIAFSGVGALSKDLNPRFSNHHNEVPVGKASCSTGFSLWGLVLAELQNPQAEACATGAGQRLYARQASK